MNNYVVEERDYKDYKIKLVSDDCPESPRDWCNLGKMVCSHRNYNLGDEQLKNSSFQEYFYNLCDIDEETPTEKAETILKENIVILPLYLMDHSGLSINTCGFSCPWDSGQVGFIYCTLEKALQEFTVTNKEEGWEAITVNFGKSLKQQILEVLEYEVQIYDDYLRGNVCGFEIHNEEDEIIDSCYGFYPEHAQHDEFGYVFKEAESIIDAYVSNHDYAML